MKKIITFATAASLMLGSMSVPVYAASFADINTVTWSGFKPFLEQAAELGLMKGYDENGKRYCKPRNNVTYCEAVQLMYSIMKVYTKQDVSDTTVTKWKTVIAAYNIPEWAYKAVAYGLENSILSTSDLNKLQNGTKYANREDVGVFFGKALDTVKGYDVKSGAVLSYADKNAITATAVPYLELLNRAKLMVGDSDNKFNPKANITRAEIAVLSVKTYTKLTETEVEQPVTNNTAVGTVTTSMVMQNGDLFITVKTTAGTVQSFFGTKGVVTAKYNGTNIGFGDIGEGDTVKVTYEGTTLHSLEVTYSKAGLKVEEEKKTTKETYELKDISSKKVVVKDGSKEKEFLLDKDVKVELDGKKSTVSKLQNALEDANYDGTLTLDADKYVLEIKAYMNKNNPLEGYVMDVSEDEIVIKAGAKEYKYSLSGDVEIEYNGKTVRFSKFESDYDDNNYFVSMKLDKNGKVVEIIIESMEDEYSGVLTFINSRRITFQSGRKEYEYDLADDVDVEIDGKDSTVAKLRAAYLDGKAYTVKVDLNRSDEVREIIATSRFNSNNEGKLEDLDSDEIKIIVNSKGYIYDLAKDVEVKINGKSRDLEDLEDSLGVYAFDVKLEFDNAGDVCKIEATLTEAKEGELRDVVEGTDTITIYAAGLNLKLELASSVDITLDGEEISLSKLNNELDYAYGDSLIYVELTYNSSNKVKGIKAYWEDVHGELDDIDADENAIKVNGKWYDVGRRAEFDYKLATSVDKNKYSSLSRYDEDIDGLEDFLKDCDRARDICEVALTLDKDKDVVRIKATAK